MEQIIPWRAKSLVVKDKTRKGKGCFLLWILTRQSPVTDCQDIFHDYQPFRLLFTAILGYGWFPFCLFSKMDVDDDATFPLLLDIKMYCAEEK